MEVNDILRQKRLENGLTLDDVARKVGVSGATISRWESGDIANMKRDKIVKLADALKVSPAVIMGWDEPETKVPSSKGVLINVYGSVAAGIPLEMIENIIDQEEITQEMARTGEFFGLRIKGDSMTPTLCDGDVVIIRKQEDAETGDTIIATVNGDDATCKRLRKYKEGIELIANNPAYEPMYFDNNAIINKPVRILGKVVELRRKF